MTITLGAAVDFPTIRHALRVAQLVDSRRYLADEVPLPHPNLPLLDRVLRQINADPASWDQDTWWSTACGSRGCVIGWALHLAGIEPPADSLDWLAAARAVLGLLPAEAVLLACPHNTHADVCDIIAGIAARARGRS